MAPGALESLSTDPFGNYVVQAMLENCSEAEVPLATPPYSNLEVTVMR